VCEIKSTVALPITGLQSVGDADPARLVRRHFPFVEDVVAAGSTTSPHAGAAAVLAGCRRLRPLAARLRLAPQVRRDEYALFFRVVVRADAQPVTSLSSSS